MHEIEFTVFLKDLETSQFFNKNKSLFTKSKPGFVVMLGVFSFIHHIQFSSQKKRSFLPKSINSSFFLNQDYSLKEIACPPTGSQIM